MEELNEESNLEYKKLKDVLKETDSIFQKYFTFFCRKLTKSSTIPIPNLPQRVIKLPLNFCLDIDNGDKKFSNTIQLAFPDFLLATSFYQDPKYDWIWQLKAQQLFSDDDALQVKNREDFIHYYQLAYGKYFPQFADIEKTPTPLILKILLAEKLGWEKMAYSITLFLLKELDLPSLQHLIQDVPLQGEEKKLIADEWGIILKLFFTYSTVELFEKIQIKLNFSVAALSEKIAESYARYNQGSTDDRAITPFILNRYGLCFLWHEFARGQNEKKCQWLAEAALVDDAINKEYESLCHKFKFDPLSDVDLKTLPVYFKLIIQESIGLTNYWQTIKKRLIEIQYFNGINIANFSLSKLVTELVEKEKKKEKIFSSLLLILELQESVADNFKYFFIEKPSVKNMAKFVTYIHFCQKLDNQKIKNLILKKIKKIIYLQDKNKNEKEAIITFAKGGIKMDLPELFDLALPLLSSEQQTELLTCAIENMKFDNVDYLKKLLEKDVDIFKQQGGHTIFSFIETFNDAKKHCVLNLMRDSAYAKTLCTQYKTDKDITVPSLALAFRRAAVCADLENMKKLYLLDSTILNQLTSDGRSALLIATENFLQEKNNNNKNKYFKIIHWLLYVGAEIECKDKAGNSFCSYSQSNNRLKELYEKNSKTSQFLQDKTAVNELIKECHKAIELIYSRDFSSVSYFNNIVNSYLITEKFIKKLSAISDPSLSYLGVLLENLLKYLAEVQLSKTNLNNTQLYAALYAGIYAAPSSNCVRSSQRRGFK